MLATGKVAGVFLVLTSLSAIWFGSLVDRFPKKRVIRVTSVRLWSRSDGTRPTGSSGRRPG